MEFRVENLCFSYKSKDILKDVCIEIKKGELVGILGKNGAGKSTLLKTIAKMLKAKKGKVFYNTLDLFELPKKEFVKKISYVSQKQVSNELNVFEMLMLGRRSYFKFKPKKEDFEEVQKIIKKLSMEEIKLKPTNELSGGELQKVAIARALIQKSEIILLDEPTNNLDIKNQIEIIKLIKNLKKTALLVLHDINLAIRYCDKLVFMKGGKIVYEGDRNIISPELIKEVYDIEVEICKCGNIPIVLPK